MTDKNSTLEVLKTLTPHEAEVLKTRFGINTRASKDTQRQEPPAGSEDGGAGGTSAPAAPPE